MVNAMPESAPLTFDDVVSVATNLERSARNISSVTVREQLGRGSFSTIKKHLDRWRAENAESPNDRVPTEIPPQLETLWREARKQAEQELTEERQALEALSTELDEKLAAMEARVAAAAQEKETAEVRLADRGQEVARLERALAEEIERGRSMETLRQKAEETHASERTHWIGQLDKLQSTEAQLLEAMRQLEQQAVERNNGKRHLNTVW